MLRSIRNSSLMRLCIQSPQQTWFRTFLSESYGCIQAWDRRFESPLLSKVNPRNLYFELNQQILNTRKITAVDVDILVNTVKDSNMVDEIIEIIHKLRLTEETSNTLDSTHHAFIRYLLDHKYENILLEVLHDRLNYGIFPDHYDYNFMMNKFIVRNDFVSAVKIAVLLMLQEDAEHPLTNALGIYSCYKYIESSDKWTLPPQPIADSNDEIVKVRIRYIRNPYFDDHFDLVEPNHLVGKSLVFFGKIFNNSLGRTCQLRGYILWSKYDSAVKLIKNWIDQGIQEIIYQEALPQIEKEILEITEDKITDDVKELKTQLEKLESLGLKKGSVIEDLETQLRQVVSERESTDIIDQCKNYDEWEKKRINVLKNQLREIKNKERLENIEKIKRNLQERERLLTFFDKEEELELRIEQKLKYENEKFGPPIEVKSEIEDNYVPPEVRKRNVPSQN